MKRLLFFSAAVAIFVCMATMPSQAYVINIFTQESHVKASADVSDVLNFEDLNEYDSNSGTYNASASVPYASSSINVKGLPFQGYITYPKIDIIGSAKRTPGIRTTASFNADVNLNFVIVKEAGDSADIINVPFKYNVEVPYSPYFGGGIAYSSLVINNSGYQSVQNAYEQFDVTFRVGQLNTLSYNCKGWIWPGDGSSSEIRSALSFGIPVAPAVPLPSAIILLGAGLGRLGLYYRRKRTDIN